MITAGLLHTLTIARFTSSGAYLTDGVDEVLLPKRYLTEGLKEGDALEVFVYRDSEDRPVAVTDRPYALAGEVAPMRVVDKTIKGAFLDWGVPKDLFVPMSNQLYRMEIGRTYVVGVYTDNVSGRVVGTARLNGFVSNEDITVRENEEVDVLVALRLEAGYRVVVNGRHWGMIYDNQVFRPVGIGDRLTGYVARVTEDGRIDVLLQKPGYGQVDDSSRELLRLLRERGGFLPLNDKSSPEEVHAATGMSKKVFKKSVGRLLKDGLAVLGEDGLALRETGPSVSRGGN